MNHVQNQHHVILFNAMDDEVVVSRKTAQAGEVYRFLCK